MIVTDLLQSLFHLIFIGFPTTFWQVRGPWKQVIQEGTVCVIFVLRYLGQQMLHVVIDFQPICLRSFCDAVNYGAGLCPADGVDQPPVVLPDTKTAQGGFRCVVIQRDFAIIQEDTQVPFLVYGICEGFPCLGFWRDFALVCFYPCKIDVNQRFQLQLSPMLPFHRLQACKFIVKFIYSPDLFQGVIRKRSLTFFFIPDGFQGFRIFASGMGLIPVLE